MVKTEDIVNFLSSNSMFVPFLVGLFYFRRLSVEMKWFYYFIVAGAVAEAGLRILYTFGNTNLWVMNLYGLAEFILLMIFFSKTISNRLLKKIYIPLMLIYVIAWLVNFSLTPISHYYILTTVGGFAVFTILAGILMTEKVLQMKAPLFKDPVFVAAFIFFLYYSTSIISNGFLRQISLIQDYPEYMFYSNLLHGLVNTFCNLLCAYALTCQTTKRSYS